MDVIQRPQRVQPRLAGQTALLPVNPPEINALPLQFTVHGQVGVEKMGVCGVEFNRRL